MNLSVLLSLGVFGIVSCGNQEESGIIKTTPVQVEVSSPVVSGNTTLNFSGKVASAKNTVLSTRVMGYVEEVLVDVGDRVTQGQLLIKINSADIRAKKMQVESMIAESKAAYENAQKDLERFEQLHKQKSATDKELENVQLNLQSMKAKYQAAQHMKEEVDVMFNYTNIVAPYDGQITQKTTAIGNIANPGMPLLMMEQQGAFQVVSMVSENNISAVKVGQSVDVYLKSIHKTIRLKVDQLSLSSLHTGGQYEVKMDVSKEDSKELMSGMYAEVTIEGDAAKIQKQSLGIQVPLEALVYKDHLVGLYVVSNGTAFLRWVKVGKAMGKDIEVLSGLSLSDRYVLHPEGVLYNGCAVAIK